MGLVSITQTTIHHSRLSIETTLRILAALKDKAQQKGEIK
jgi:hypothetical protein